MKRTAAALMILITSLSLAGCKAQELQLYSIVTGIAVDHGEQGLRVTLESGGGMAEDGIQTKPAIDFGEGGSFSDCLSDSFRKTGKFPYLRHTGAMLISENTQGESLRRLLYFIVNEHNVRLNTRILAVKGGEAGELFTEKEYFSTKALRASAVSSKSLTAADMMLAEFIYLIYARGIDGFLPLAGREKTEGLALFKGYDRTGELPPDLVPVFLMAKNRAESGNFTVKHGGEDCSFKLTRSKSRMTSDIENGVQNINLHIKADFRAEDMLTEEASVYEEQLRNKIEEDALRMTDILKGCGCDALGAGQYIYRRNPRLWESSEGDKGDMFENSRVHITAEAHIESTGRTKEESR